MRLGRIPQTAYRRSVLPQLYTEGTALFPPGQEERCNGFACGDMAVLSAGAVLCGREEELGLLTAARAANHLAARGVRARGVSLQILLPEQAQEEFLGVLMERTAQAAREQGFSLDRAEVRTTPELSYVVVQAEALGTAALQGAQPLLSGDRAAAGQDIVMVKWAGLEGAYRLWRHREQELKKRFPASYLEPLRQCERAVFSIQEMCTAAALGASAVHQITDGGVLAALWEMAERAGFGLDVDLRKMPVRQETVEVCEYFHLDPYKLASAGSFLAVTPRGEELADALNREDAAAAVIGYTTDGRERIARSRGGVRYLDRPSPDELTKLV